MAWKRGRLARVHVHREANVPMGNHRMLPVSRTRHRRAPTPPENARPSGNPARYRGQCRGNPVGRPLGTAHTGQQRPILCDHRARRHQGDAPRRPYVPCVQPRALHQQPSQHARRTSCRGGSRSALTTRRDVRGAHVAQFWTQFLDTLESLPSLKVGCCDETVGRQISHNDPSRHSEQRTNIDHSPRPRLRIPLQVSTTNPEGKEAICGAGNTTSSVPGKFCACPEIRYPRCPRISVRVPKFSKFSPLVLAGVRTPECSGPARARCEQEADPSRHRMH